MTKVKDIEAIYNRYDLSVLKVISAQGAEFIKKETDEQKKKKKSSSGEEFGELLDQEIKKLQIKK